jgi:hypothetical protein
MDVLRCPKADPGLAAAWWIVLLLRGILPAAFGIAMGVLVGGLPCVPISTPYPVSYFTNNPAAPEGPGDNGDPD